VSDLSTAATALAPDPASRENAAPGAGRPPRLPSLTGLRFFAALGVFAYHVLGLIPVPHVLRPLFMAGQSGVSFFFVLSGFVLTWSFRPGAAREFWQRRIARVVPSHVVTWVIGIPAAAARFGAWPHAVPLLATLGLVQSWIPQQSAFFGVNGVAWSLSCEAFFYALFPLLIPVVRRLGPRQRRSAATLCLLALALPQLGAWWAVGDSVAQSSGLTFWLVSVLPLSRLPEFVFGMLVAQACRDGQRSPVPLRVAVLLSVTAGYLAGLFPTAVVAGWLTALPFGLVLWAAADRDLAGRAGRLAGRWPVRLGEWSYAFYLCHQLVLRLVGWRWPAGHWWIAQVTVDLVLAGLASAALYRWVEVPFERRLRPTRTAARAF
jgi:peptidoglycan/LPS O-acetylase OafA/YrhL